MNELIEVKSMQLAGVEVVNSNFKVTQLDS